MRWPRISVVVPSLDQGAFLEAALRSLLDQGYPDLEVLVVDGGSSDQSATVLERFSPRLAWWCSEPDQGQADAINKGFRRATGEVLGWLNSDDILLPGSLHTIGRAFAKQPERMVTAGLRREVHEDGTVGAPWIRDRPTPRNLRRYCCLAQESVYFRRQVYEALGGLDASMHFALDYAYWLRMIDAGFSIDLLPAYLGGCRDHPRTKRATRPERGDLELRRLARRHRLGRNEEEATLRGGLDAQARMAVLEDLSHSRLARWPRLVVAMLRLLDLPAVERRVASTYRRYRFRRPRHGAAGNSHGNGNSVGERRAALLASLAGELLGRPQPDAIDPATVPPSPVMHARLSAADLMAHDDLMVPAPDTLALGMGWSWLETSRDCIYRWAESGAEILIARPTGTRGLLRLDLEPGPSLGWRPFTLSVVDESGRVLVCEEVDGASRLTLPIPLACGPAVRRLRLMAPGEGRPANDHDPRVLDFRATFVGWEDGTPGNGE